MNNMIPFPAPPRMTPQGGQGQQTQANPMQMIMGQVMQGLSPAGIVERIGGPYWIPMLAMLVMGVMLIITIIYLIVQIFKKQK